MTRNINISKLSCHSMYVLLWHGYYIYIIEILTFYRHFAFLINFRQNELIFFFHMMQHAHQFYFLRKQYLFQKNLKKWFWNFKKTKIYKFSSKKNCYEFKFFSRVHCNDIPVSCFKIIIWTVRILSFIFWMTFRPGYLMF